MIKKYRLFISVFILAFLLIGFAIPVLAATGADGAFDGLQKTANMGYTGNPGDDDPSGIPKSIPETIGKIVGAGLAFIGIIFFILMIYGGFVWMMARGNDQEVEKAKTLIQSAVIGLIIVLSAYALTAFIGNVILK